MSLGAPFTNPKPLGWALFEVLTSAQMSAVNANAANAADGSAWSDIAILKNWHYATLSIPSPMSGNTLMYDPATRYWFVAGGNTANAEFTTTGAQWFNTGTGNFGNLAPTMVQCTALAGNGQGVLLAGGLPFSATTGHMKESTDGGATWGTVRNIGASDTNGVFAIVWIPSLNLWLASQGGVGAGGIYSSSDRVTWTLRGAANNPPTYFAVRNTPSPIIIGTKLVIGGGSLNYVRSTDGITWTTIAFPAGVGNNPCQGCWSDALGNFYIGGSSGVFRSADATLGSWALVDTSWNTVPSAASIAAFGRLLIRGDGKASLDGANWFRVIDTQANDLYVSSSSVGVVAVRASTTESWVSQQIGS